jgi:hypothetical protein
MSLGIAAALLCLSACKKKPIKPDTMEILSADVEGGKELTVRFVLLDGAGKRMKIAGDLSVSYNPAGSALPSCTLLGDSVGEADFAADAGGPIGVATWTLTENCGARAGVRYTSSYVWRANELEDELPILVGPRKVVIPKHFGGTGAPIAEGDQEAPPPDAASLAILDQAAAELIALAPLVPEPDPKGPLQKCPPELAENLHLVDYDLVTSLESGEPLLDLDLVRKHRNEASTHPRQLLSDDVVWHLGVRKWGLATDREDREVAATLAAWAKPIGWAFVRPDVYVNPKISEYKKYSPGVLVGRLFVVDAEKKQVVCQAPVVVMQTKDLPEIFGDPGTTINLDFIHLLARGLADAKLALGAPEPPPDAGL